MDATFRTSANNSYTNGADAGKPDTVKTLLRSIETVQVT